MNKADGYTGGDDETPVCRECGEPLDDDKWREIDTGVCSACLREEAARDAESRWEARHEA